MGRPLNKKYFGNRNVGTAATTDNGIGGQGVASVTVAGEFSGFTLATTTVTFAAPTLPSGVTATGTATIVAGEITAIVITNSGSGYVSAPAVTVADSDVGAEVTTGTLTAVLTTDSGSAGSSTNQENAIIVTAFIPAANGGTAAATGDIVKQTNDRRYKVKTSEGTGICQLKTTAAANAAGEMSIKAIDSEGKNYLVAKLTSRKVVLVPAALGGSAGTQFASGTSAKWTFGSAVLNTTVKIENA
jgi:hypothetical protein